MPLDIDVAIVVCALAEGGGELFAGPVGNLAGGFELRCCARVFDKQRASSGWNDDCVAFNKADVARADEMVFPVHATVAGRELGAGLHRRFESVHAKRSPGFTAPAISLETDDFLHEIPIPFHLTVIRDRKNLRAERGEIHAILPDDRRAEDRLLAIDLLHHRARCTIQHIINPRCGAEVQILPDDGRGADVVHVLLPALALELPYFLERRRIEART